MSLGTHLATFLRGLGYCHHHSAIHTELRINPIMSGIRIPAVMFSKHRKMQIFYFFTDSWFWSKKMRQKYISSFFERIAWQWEIQFNSIYFDFILFDPKKFTHDPIMSGIRIPAVVFSKLRKMQIFFTDFCFWSKREDVLHFLRISEL